MIADYYKALPTSSSYGQPLLAIICYSHQRLPNAHEHRQPMTSTTEHHHRLQATASSTSETQMVVNGTSHLCDPAELAPRPSVQQSIRPEPYINIIGN